MKNGRIVYSFFYLVYRVLLIFTILITLLATIPLGVIYLLSEALDFEKNENNNLPHY